MNDFMILFPLTFFLLGITICVLMTFKTLKKKSHNE